jgi:hypothetical protein
MSPVERGGRRGVSRLFERAPTRRLGGRVGRQHVPASTRIARHRLVHELVDRNIQLARQRLERCPHDLTRPERPGSSRVHRTRLGGLDPIARGVRVLRVEEVRAATVLADGQMLVHHAYPRRRELAGGVTHERVHVDVIGRRMHASVAMRIDPALEPYVVRHRSSVLERSYSSASCQKRMEHLVDDFSSRAFFRESRSSDETVAARPVALILNLILEHRSVWGPSISVEFRAARGATTTDTAASGGGPTK